jgi:hypothetical protein
MHFYHNIYFTGLRRSKGITFPRCGVYHINYTPTEDTPGLPRPGSGDWAGVDLLDGASEAFDDCAPTRPRMATEPPRLWDGVDADESVVGAEARFHGNFCRSHPVHVLAAACRSRSSRLRSNAVRYRS